MVTKPSSPANPPVHTPAQAPSPSGESLREAVNALLASKKGIDEHQAKQLRKQWGLYRERADASTPDAADPLDALFAQLRARVHAQVDLREKQYAEVEAQLQALRASMKNGDVQQSQCLEQTIVNGLNRITQLSSQRRQKIIHGVEALRPQLNKLTGWRKWGTVQARKALIDEIKNIHAAGAPFAQVAKRIKQARAEWQEWDHGGEGGDTKLYRTFDATCTKAYQPCQAHFDQQKKQFLKNGAAQEKICATLEQAFAEIEWRDPDWRTLQHLKRNAGTDWRKAGPADYAQRKPLQRRFAAILEKFAEPMEREQQRNRRIREKLIAEVEQLAQQEDITAAMAKLQALKKQWLPTVPSSRETERAMWKRFTEFCDQIHTNQKRAREEFKRTLKDNLVAREALCAEIEGCFQGEKRADKTTKKSAKLLENEDKNENGGKGDDAHAQPLTPAQLAQWQSRWEQFGDAPKASASKIDARYRNAVKRARAIMAEAARAQQTQQQNLLREKSLICAQLETLALAGAPQTGVSALTDRWASLDSSASKADLAATLPDDVTARLKARYGLATRALTDAKAAKKLGASQGEQLETMNALLLQLEILAELDSPAEFSRQRMALQIGRLSAVMGKGTSKTASQPAEPQSAEQLIRAILLVAALNAEQHSVAFKRLDRCVDALAASAG